MHDRILIAKIGWADHYQGEGELMGFAGGGYYERFNFRRAPNGRFHGSIPRRSPTPKVPTGWLVLFIAPVNGRGPWYAVGWYENATFETGDQPGISENSPYGTPFTYCVHTEAKDAHLIGSKLRPLFPAPCAGEHFGNTTFICARDLDKPAAWNEPWRTEFAQFAETVASGQMPALPSPAQIRSFWLKPRRISPSPTCWAGITEESVPFQSLREDEARTTPRRLRCRYSPEAPPACYAPLFCGRRQSTSRPWQPSDFITSGL